MPPGTILITSANCATAKRLIPGLREEGYHTIGLVRKPTETGTHERIDDWMHNPAARLALEKADTIIHLSGDANAPNKAQYKEANYDTTRLIAESVRQTSTPQRIIYLSYANAVPHSRNLYLRYKGQAEEILKMTGKELVIFRCPVIIDAPGEPSRMDELFKAQNGKPIPVIGTGEQRMHPVYRGDVVNAILSAISGGKPGIYDLSGPQGITINSFIGIVNNNQPVKTRHIPGWLAKTMSYFLPKLSPVFVDLMLDHTDSTYSPDTYREFGVTPTSIDTLFKINN